MQDTVKIGAAAVGGYVLGRTKKAKAAVGLAMWLAGRGRARDMARDQVLKAVHSDRGQELLGQLRGPVLESGRRAAMAMFESQAGKLADRLEGRAGEAGGRRGGRAGRGRQQEEDAGDDEEPEGEDDEYEDDEYDDEESDEEPEDEEDEYEDDEYEDEESEEDFAEEPLEEPQDDFAPPRRRQRRSA